MRPLRHYVRGPGGERPLVSAGPGGFDKAVAGVAGEPRRRAASGYLGTYIRHGVGLDAGQGSIDPVDAPYTTGMRDGFFTDSEIL